MSVSLGTLFSSRFLFNSHILASHIPSHFPIFFITVSRTLLNSLHSLKAWVWSMAGRCVTLGTDAGLVYYPAISTRKRETPSRLERVNQEPYRTVERMANDTNHSAFCTTDLIFLGVEEVCSNCRNSKIARSQTFLRYSHGDNDNSWRFKD